MAQAREQTHHTADEIVALSLLVLGTLVFLSLISYAASDVPTWFPLSSEAHGGRGTANFIGPVGAIIACTLYSFLGAAAYLLAGVLLGFGGIKLLNPETQISRRIPWFAAFVLSGACLAHLLPFAFIDATRLSLAVGEGGWLGLWLGQNVFGKLLGPVGAGLILALVYVVSLILMTDLHPIALVRQGAALPRIWREKRHAWKMARADEQERLGLEARRMEKERRKLERALAKQGVAMPAEAEAGAGAGPAKAETFTLQAEDEPARPEPQIIDSNAPPPVKKAKKSHQFQPLTPVSCDDYELPSLELLEPVDLEGRQTTRPEELLAIQDTIIETLAEFGIAVTRGDITRGPTITRYEVYPASGVRVDKIVSLERDIARATRAERINTLAPIPGKDTVGIEIANSKKQKVTLRELLESDDFVHTKAKIPVALGKDVYGKTIIGDLAAMPHGLVAGTTGSGKSVCINAIIASILYRFTPADLRLIMIDPKVVEMQMYNTLPHLVVPVVTDPKKVLLALRWAVDEMEKRYAIFAKTGVRNIDGFNARPLPKSQAQLDAERGSASVPASPGSPLEDAARGDRGGGGESRGMDDGRAARPLSGTEPLTIDFSAMSDGELFDVAPKPKIEVPRDAEEIIIPERMPYIVIIVDELADLMQTAPADVESAIARITQKARAAGIHMILATQTPRADVITGVIKANVPCRIAFQVASPLDSRVILDENGAERLLGQGDMLYRPPGTSRMTRAQGVLVTDDEVHRLVDHAAQQGEPAFETDIHDRLQAAGAPEEEEVSDEDEELVEKCIEVMRQEKKASTSLFQRRLRLGYTRAARILDILEARGYVGPGEGAKPREILRDLDLLTGE
ncbi:MAG TPA: DNA translocase FtsK [Chthoniobacteraceae bacterium]|nr:DNA translocase FtsK [Chthoniobacteraceae bacterium]